MNQALNYAHKYIRKAAIAQWALVLVTLLLTACGALGGGGNSSLGHLQELPAQSEAVLTCSQECAQQGWCGTTNDERSVILGNSVSPASAGHDLVFLQNTPVFINQLNKATMETLSTAEQSQLTFYHVTSTDQGKTAWVAGWCIAAP